MRPLHSSSESHGRGAPSYFAHEPGALLPPPGSPESPGSPASPSGLTKTPLTSEGFTFRHFPAEDANFTNEPFASNPKVASILRCSMHGSSSPMVSNPPTPVILEESPDLQIIPGSVPIIPDDAVVGTRLPQSPLGSEGELSYENRHDEFGEESRKRVAGPESHVGFALSGLTHLGPVRDAFKHTRASMSEHSTGGAHSQRSARSKSKHDEHSQGSPKFQEQAEIISSVKGDERVSSATSSFSVATRSSQQSGSPMVTMRFEHREDENGHHVLVGREGKLTRCGDEPIRIPGAVQGFGVLMVLHDDRKTGKLPVRQVSEVSLSLNESVPSQFLPELQCDPWRHTKVSLQPRLLHGHVATKPG